MFGSSTSSGLFGGAGANAGGAGNSGFGGGSLGANAGNAGGATTGPLGSAGPAGSTGSTGSTGLFGANNAGGATGSTGATGGFGGSGGLFGQQLQQPQQPQQGGLFGLTSGGSQATGGLFGQQGQQAGQQGSQQGQGQSLFGQSQQSSGLFGQKPAQSGGLFQNQGQSGQSGQSGGQFGVGQGGGLFQNQGQSLGQASSANSAQPSFGWSQSQPQPQPQGLFGPQPAAAAPTPYTPAVIDQLLKIKEQWDPSSGKCALKTHFYNKLSEAEAQMALQRPTNELPEDWDAAMRARPLPQYYPVKVTSFLEVAQRIEVQLEHVAKARVVLAQIDDKQQQVLLKHDLNNTTRIAQAKGRHVRLLRRLLRLATMLAILKLKGYPLLPEEEEILRQFERLNQQLADPLRALGKMNDVFARLAVLKDRLADLRDRFAGVQHLDAPEAAAGARDGDAVEAMAGLMMKMQTGLNHLNAVLEKDMEVVRAQANA